MDRQQSPDECLSALAFVALHHSSSDNRTFRARIVSTHMASSYISRDSEVILEAFCGPFRGGEFDRLIPRDSAVVPGGEDASALEAYLGRLDELGLGRD